MTTTTSSRRFSRAVSLVVLATCAAVGASGQVGTTGMAFLKLGTDARSAALADAVTSIASGAAAATQNPAGLVSPAGPGDFDLLFTHRSWIQSTRMQYLSFRIGLDSLQSIGLSLSSVSTDDIQIRTRPGPSEGSFAARNASLGLTYARAFGPLAFGVTAKMLYEKMLVDDATGFAVDIGGAWHAPVAGLTVGAALQHLGGMSALREESTTLPALLRVGPSYKTAWEGARLDLTAAGDISYVFEEGEPYAALGAELTYDGMAAARAGYRFGSEARGFSAGVGFRYTLVRLDYAYAPLAAGLGNTHTVSLGVTF